MYNINLPFYGKGFMLFYSKCHHKSILQLHNINIIGLFHSITYIIVYPQWQYTAPTKIGINNILIPFQYLYKAYFNTAFQYNKQFIIFFPISDHTVTLHNSKFYILPCSITVYCKSTNKIDNQIIWPLHCQFHYVI